MLRVQARPSSGDSEQGIDTAAREDLAKLQRQFKVTEGSRKQYADQAINHLRKQQAMIEALEAENADLKKNLSLASSKQNEIKDQQIASKFEDLISKHAHFKKCIAEEEQSIAELERKIKEMEASINSQRKDMGGVHMSQTHHIVLQKQIRVKENRLDKALVRFNSALATNTKLRTMIDHLRQERSVFEGMYKKLQRELIECKRSMGEVIELSTQAYEARDDAQNKMLGLKEKADKEMSQYTMEMKELKRVIDHDRKLKDFMSHKDQERREAHEEMETMRLKKEAEKNSEREGTVTSYEQAFEQIKEATGITDIDQLVTKFIEVEDQNFALFNYVNELNGEIELVLKQIQQIKADIEQFKSQGVEMEEKRKAILRGLESDLAEVNEQAADFEARYTASRKVLDQMKSGIDSVFSKISCDATAITDLLGGHAGVTDTTVLQYLGIVEQRANELLQLQAFIQAKESEDPEAMTKFLMGVGPVGSLAAPSFVLPTTGDDYESESDEEEGKPLTTEELRARAAKGITTKKLAAPQGTTGLSPSQQPPSTAATGKNRAGGTTEKKKRALATR